MGAHNPAITIIICVRGTCIVRFRVHVPVKDLRGRGIAQRAIGDQAHVRVVRFDGKVESQVVSYVGWVPTILHTTTSFVFEAHTSSDLIYMNNS